MKFQRTLGQHILSNTVLASSIVKRARLRPRDLVVEIGPGTGRLTRPLVESAPAACSFTAIERDRRMIEDLSGQAWYRDLPPGRMELVQGCALEVPFPSSFDVVVANLPFQISSRFVFKLMRLMATVVNEEDQAEINDRNDAAEEEHPLQAQSCSGGGSRRSALLMVQKEFADRLWIQPGEQGYARLSAAFQRFMDATLELDVSRGNFTPPPRVDAAVVTLTPKHPLVTTREFDGYMALLRLCFHRKNKSMRAVLTQSAALRAISSAAACSGGANSDPDRGSNHFEAQTTIMDRSQAKAAVEAALAEAGGLGSARAAHLGPADFDALAVALRARGVDLALAHDIPKDG